MSSFTRWLATGALAGSLFLAQAPGAGRAEAGQTIFKRPQDALTALLSCIKQDDPKSVRALFGSEGKAFVESGDTVDDARRHKDLMRVAAEKATVVSLKDNRCAIVLGKDGWFFPVPLVKDHGGWRFDSKAGQEEIFNRRIGANEIHTIMACHAYVDAQRTYASTNPGGGAYAARFISSAGQKDGLYWAVAQGEAPSPLGPLFAQASSEGYSQGSGAFHGYHFKILTSQGKNAPGGEKNYLVGGRMSGGFALVAWPTEWRNSGVMTFVVNQSGIVFQRDLGRDTDKKVADMQSFDPDDTWQPARLP